MTSTLVAGTTPYPWPYDADLSPSRLALIIAGYGGGWRQRCIDSGSTDAPLGEVAAAVAAVGGLVVCLVHPGEGSESDDTDDTPFGVDARTITTGGIDGFFGSDLDHQLRRAGRDHLLLAGYGLEATVHSTMRSANDRGYECLLLLDATASLSADTRDPARSMVEMSGGIFGAVGSSAALLLALDHLLPTAPATSVPSS